MNKYKIAVFTRELTLPRFTMKIGDEWRVRVERLTRKGFTLGGGFVGVDSYTLINDRKGRHEQ